MYDLEQILLAHFPCRLYFFPLEQKELAYYPYISFSAQRFCDGGFGIISSLDFWPLEVLSIFPRRRIYLESIQDLVLQVGGYGIEGLRPDMHREVSGPVYALNKYFKACRCMTALAKDYLFHSARVQKTSHFFIFLNQMKSGSEHPPT